VAGFSVVDAGALTALPDATIGDGHRSGLLSLIYAHMGSLARLRALMAD
jgi:hypothetical protein